MNQTAWVEQGRQLYRTHATSQFEIGDWVNVGIGAFGRSVAFDARLTCHKVNAIYPEAFVIVVKLPVYNDAYIVRKFGKLVSQFAYGHRLASGMTVARDRRPVNDARYRGTRNFPSVLLCRHHGRHERTSRENP